MSSTSCCPGGQMKPPLEIGEFRQLTAPSEQYLIPEVPEKRKVTDLKFTITFIVFLVILVPFLIYTFVHSDLDRITRGYNMCGNICGKNNTHVSGIACSGQDKTNLPFLMFREDNESESSYKEEIIFDCVESCDSSKYIVIFNRCFPRNVSNDDHFIEELSADINRSAGRIILVCFIGLGISVVMLFLFRYCVDIVVWVSLIGSVLGILILTGIFWYLFNNNGDKTVKYLAIVFTIISVAWIIMLICLIKKVKLVIRLFREAIKIIFGIPLILFEPLLTLIARIILFSIFIFFLLIFCTAGMLEHIRYDLYDFVPNGVIIFTIFYHAVISLWMFQFIIGCQHMVVSGAVSAYYFARDKSALVSPIYYSFYNLMRYHLGTVAFGSLIITIVVVIKALLRALAHNKYAKIFVDCCLGVIEDFLKYLSKNAYIQTAMHGQPFYKSGKRAVRLLAANAIDAIAVNSVGDFVLNMAKFLIVVCTVGVGTLVRDTSLTYPWVSVVIGAFVTAIIADCLFSVFETAVDTIFLCFCEDNCLNDGFERAYYMNTNLKQYIEDAKKAYKKKSKENKTTSET